MREERTPCCNPVNDTSMWTSESPHDRALACSLCQACPVLQECRAYGAVLTKDEKAGVYGGVDPWHEAEAWQTLRKVCGGSRAGLHHVNPLQTLHGVGAGTNTER